MAFKFNWPSFSKEFIEQARQLLNSALNKSNKPANIVDHIIVKELNMGTQAPELEILEIGELVLDKFRGIFKLTYNGDAFLVLQTKVQANPMNNNKSDISTYTRRGILAADQPLVVPMLLRLSDVKLRGIVVLVVSKQKGITLVFKNDPLEKVDVTSTFDGVSSVQRFLQTEIEKRLRTMFQEDLPSIVHQLSLKWSFSPLDNNYHQYYEKRSQQQQEFVLQPSETSVAAQLASLMNSNHTISPYTRTLQHLTFRSYPHPINKKLVNKRSKSGVKRNVLKLPGLTTSF